MKKLVLFVLLCSTVLYAQSDEGWILHSTGSVNEFPVTMANGRIGIVTSPNPFTFSKIILNGVYDKQNAEGVSKIVMGTVFANLELKVDGQPVTPEKMKNISQAFDMKKARLETSFEFENKIKITTYLYALYSMPYCCMLDILITPIENCELEVQNKMTVPKGIIEPTSSFKILKDLDYMMPFQQTLAKTEFKKYTIAATSVYMFENIKPELKETKAADNLSVGFTAKLEKGKNFSFALGGSVCNGEEMNDPKTESERMCTALLMKNKKDILEEHFLAWEEIWKNDIVIEGDLKAQQAVRLALFNIFSSVRKDSRLSIAPMGLTSQGYLGHVFWDMELWMFPVILAFDKDLAKTILDYRFDRLQKAKQKARNFGYKGAMYPWESDDSGEEATPAWALTGTLEHHITADVGIACWNYYRVTKDNEWLKTTGYPMLKEIADFWVSRVKKGTDNKYHINNIVGADEFFSNINDNAFTNASAITVLNYAMQAAKELKMHPDSTWASVASKIAIEHFTDGVTKENSTYNGDTIKQADVNLLAYPLNFYSDEKQIRKDLDYYELRMHPDGPAMSHSVLSVIYSRLGDCEKAYKLFGQSYKPNQRGPFGLMAESAYSNNPYFNTGAGGMLQAIIYGFAGLEITDNGLTQRKSCLPKEWKSITIKGLECKQETIKISQ